MLENQAIFSQIALSRPVLAHNGQVPPFLMMLWLQALADHQIRDELPLFGQERTGIVHWHAHRR